MTVSKELLRLLPLTEQAIQDAKQGYCMDVLGEDVLKELQHHLYMEIEEYLPSELIEIPFPHRALTKLPESLSSNLNYFEQGFSFDFDTPNIRPLVIKFSIHTGKARPLVLTSTYKVSAIGRLEALDLYIADVVKQHLDFEAKHNAEAKAQKIREKAETEAQKTRHSSVTLGKLNDTESVALFLPVEMKSFLAKYNYTLEEVLYHTTDEMIDNIKKFKEHE